MIRPALFALFASGLLASGLAPAQAQEQPVNVYFQPLAGGEFSQLNKAIQNTLSQPPMQLVAKPFAGVLVIAVVGQVDVTHKKVSGTDYEFTVAFTRDGSSLGQSGQACNSNKLAECTDQLLLDVKSLTGPK